MKTNYLYNEFKHCGVDYSDNQQAKAYDTNHKTFRDYEKEFNDTVNFLELKNVADISMVDLGCGTGAMSIYGAKIFRKVYAVDISPEMIKQAKQKSETENVNNIEFINAGFLTYKHTSDPADLLITKFAFHHLPDFWKQIALFNMNSMLKADGILYINDVVFNFEPAQYISKIDTWLDWWRSKTDSAMVGEIETHIREEYSTFTWILEGMIEKAGFLIEKKYTTDDFVMEYKCRKVKFI
jgi:ubiquinone/menaquinone biosynthesis C-methylase UbiE